MLKTVEDISSTKKRLKIEIPSETIESEIQSGLKGVQKQAKIPGFRQGKTPLSIIEKRFGKDVEGDVMERLVPKAYTSALEEANIKPVGMPELEGKIEIKRNEPLEMTLTVEIRPEVKDLKYDGVKVKEIPVEVKDDEVDDALNNVRQQKTVYEPTEEAAKHGDMVVMDYSTTEEGKEPQEFQDHTYRLGHGVMPEEFSKALEGMKKGETKEFKVPFPEDFPSKDIAGQEVAFKVEVKEVKKPELPELDDEFAKDLGFDDIAGLRKHIEEQIRSSKENSARQMQKAEVVSKIVADHEVDAPESMVETEIKNLLAEAQEAGRTEEKEEDLRAEFKSRAESRVKASIVLDIIGEKENVEVSEEEIKQKVDSMATRIGMAPENIMKYYVSRDGSLDGLRNEVMEEKVLDLLLERADISKGEQE